MEEKVVHGIGVHPTGQIPAAATRRNSFSRYFKANKWLYLLLIPGFMYLFVFKYIPMFGIVIAFKKFNIVKGIWGSEWVGIENFRFLFQSKDFWIVFKNSIVLSLYQILWGFPVPILLAIMLNEVGNAVYKRITQTIMYLPHFISWVIIAGMVINFLSPTTGVINHIIKFFGGSPVAFLQQPEYFRTILISAEIWKGAGWGTIIYLAAITGIDKEVYEAATIDGASRIQRIRYVTLPGIMGTIVTLLILNTGHIMSNGFEQVFLLYNPLTYSVADVFETYTYRIGIQSGRFSYASAAGLFQSVIGLILILSTNRVAKSFGERGIW